MATLIKITDIEFIGYLAEDTDSLENWIQLMDTDQHLIPCKNSQNTVWENLINFLGDEETRVETDPLIYDTYGRNYCDPMVEGGCRNGKTYYGYYYVITESIPTTEFSVLSHYLSAIFNGDFSGLSDEDTEELTQALDRFGCDLTKGDILEEEGFGTCDLTGSRGTCSTIWIRDEYLN